MPTVGTKKFAYTKAGQNAAKKYAKKLGRKVTGVKKGRKKPKLRKGAMKSGY